MQLDQDIIDILKIKASTKSLGSESGNASPQFPKSLPILGLADIVIFPGMVAPLLIESVSSNELIDDVVSGDRLIGLVLQTTPVDDPSPKIFIRVVVLPGFRRWSSNPTSRSGF